MTPLPKRKFSTRRSGKREAHLNKRLSLFEKCPNCGSLKRSHRICPSCGFYNKREVISPKKTKSPPKKA
ncbi:50S ribosomal protein L32 [Candidatus Gottesmanbacteria bacterium]|nr:50S ribosomal protein L32 [Candidatus Gottesmanbacteria bacterium]